MGHRILVAVALVYLIAANIVWIAIDTRSPFWDTAYHELAALRVFRDVSHNGLAAIRTIPHDSGSYPPLYYLIIAISYGLFGTSVDAAQWANLPAIVVLALSTYGIARSVLEPRQAAVASVLVNFFPYLLWISRETLIDFWLTAMVALALWCLIRTRNFEDARACWIFGVVAGLGMLTKWTFVLYLGLPALWAARKHWRHALAAAGIAAGIAAYWYWPQAATMPDFWRQNVLGGQAEGDPAPWTWQGVIFYARALESYQLFLPLFILFLLGSWQTLRARTAAWIPIVLCLAGGWTSLLMISNKDPRYSAPLLSVVAVISAAAFQSKRKWPVALLCCFLAFQHYLVSFGIRQLPPTVVLAKGIAGPLSWDWNLYSQRYLLGFMGSPGREDWQIEAVLKRITGDGSGAVRLGIIPDIGHFDAHAFNFYISLRNYPVVLTPLHSVAQPELQSSNYILLSETDQGYLANLSPDIAQTNRYVLGHPERFRMVDTFTLPNGDVIHLYKSDPPHIG